MGEQRACLASIRTNFVMPLAVLSPHWATGKSMGHRHFGVETDGTAEPCDQGRVGKASPPGTVLCGHSQEMGPAAHLDIAETRQQGLGA